VFGGAASGARFRADFNASALECGRSCVVVVRVDHVDVGADARTPIGPREPSVARSPSGAFAIRSCISMHDVDYDDVARRDFVFETSQNFCQRYRSRSFTGHAVDVLWFRDTLLVHHYDPPRPVVYVARVFDGPRGTGPLARARKL
jgi:hypothetical protein